MNKPENLLLETGAVVSYKGSGLLEMKFPDGSILESNGNFTTLLMYEFLLRFIEQDSKPKHPNPVRYGS